MGATRGTSGVTIVTQASFSGPSLNQRNKKAAEGRQSQIVRKSEGGGVISKTRQEKKLAAAACRRSRKAAEKHAGGLVGCIAPSAGSARLVGRRARSSVVGPSVGGGCWREVGPPAGSSVRQRTAARSLPEEGTRVQPQPSTRVAPERHVKTVVLLPVGCDSGSGPGSAGHSKHAVRQHVSQQGVAWFVVSALGDATQAGGDWLSTMSKREPNF